MASPMKHPPLPLSFLLVGATPFPPAAPNPQLQSPNPRSPPFPLPRFAHLLKRAMGPAAMTAPSHVLNPASTTSRPSHTSPAAAQAAAVSAEGAGGAAPSTRSTSSSCSTPSDAWDSASTSKAGGGGGGMGYEGDGLW